jgi:hypothetical protein
VKKMTSTIVAAIVVLIGIPLFALIATNGPRR